MHTAIAILNWNTVDYLRRLLPPLIASTEGEDAEIIVIDNASTDGSMEMMEKEFPDIRTIRLDRNYGFTGGYDRGLEPVDADCFILLNTDVEVPVDWLGPILRTMENCPEVGACAPKIMSWHDRKSFEYAGAAGGYIDSLGFPFCRGRVPGKVEKDEGQYDNAPRDVMWASGACLAVRSGLFRKLGGLDDRFFAHMEEIDFCWRLQLEGYAVRIVPESKVWHIGGGTLPQTSPRKLKFNFRNNLLMLQNNLARTFAIRLLNSGLEPAVAARKACRKARRRIFLRMMVDGAAALAYLLKADIASFRAVVEAHSEFRKLGNWPSAQEVGAFAAGHPDSAVRGIMPGSIVLKTLVYGKNIFSKLRYADYH